MLDGYGLNAKKKRRNCILPRSLKKMTRSASRKPSRNNRKTRVKRKGRQAWRRRRRPYCPLPIREAPLHPQVRAPIRLPDLNGREVKQMTACALKNVSNFEAPRRSGRRKNQKPCWRVSSTHRGRLTSAHWLPQDPHATGKTAYRKSRSTRLSMMIGRERNCRPKASAQPVQRRSLLSDPWASGRSLTGPRTSQ